MIDSKFAAEQIQRLSGLDFYPKEKPALKELRVALEVAISDSIAVTVITEWLAYHTESPKPSDLRRLCYEQNEKHKAVVAACQQCGGSGFRTIWKLVTYHGKSSQMKRSERVPESEWRALAEKLAAEPIGNDRQQVLSAAEVCGCRNVTAHHA